MHRKTRVIPVGEIVTFTLLLILAVALLTGLSWLGSPAAASANPAMFEPAASAAAHLATAEPFAPTPAGTEPVTWTATRP
jgi:hypothetical protein